MTDDMRWEAVLPLRREHELTRAAADQLYAALADAKVFLGRPEPGVRRNWQTCIGRCVEREVIPAEPGEVGAARVRVIVELTGEMGEQALAHLREGNAGLGLDLSGEFSPRNQLPVGHPSRHRLITAVTRLNCLEVVPMMAPVQEGKGVAPPLPEPGS